MRVHNVVCADVPFVFGAANFVSTKETVSKVLQNKYSSLHLFMEYNNAFILHFLLLSMQIPIRCFKPDN